MRIEKTKRSSVGIAANFVTMAETAGCLGKAVMPARVVKAEVKVAKTLETEKAFGMVKTAPPSATRQLAASLQPVLGRLA